MASTSAMYSGLSGLSANARRLEVIGNNIANVNTTAFKGSRMLFAPQFSRTFNLGSGPSGASGGTNPGQVGLGVGLAAIQRNFGNGGVTATGISTDMAVEGDGMFIVSQGGQTFYTRDGSFQFDAGNNLVTPGGAQLQGFLVDDSFNVIEGAVQDLSIPLGVLTIAEATSNVEFSGNLNADGDVATSGSVFTFGLLDSISLGGPALDTTTLIDLDDGGGSPVFAVGDTITLKGAERGGKVVPEQTFTVSAADDLATLLNWMQGVMGVVPAGSAGPPPADAGGWSVVGGVITFNGNFGELNDLKINPENIQINVLSGAANPFVPTKGQNAAGESVRTTFVVYDSLGSPLNVDVTMVLADADDGGTYWRSYLHSDEDTDLATHLEMGDRSSPPFSDSVPLIQFDNDGKLVSTTPISVELDRFNTGATDALIFTMSFNAEGSNVSALASTDGSVLASTFQDGSPIGVLSSFGVGIDGIITGGFTNGLTRTLGQVALAKFSNPEGLIDTGNNLFEVGANSGTPLITNPLEFGTGRILGGALELSNVDLSEEFTNMILTSTGYSAASRVISTTDQLLQQLLQIAR